MEKIIIKDFLIFDDIEMELNKFNILIGPQASGKSLLAKLVYYFKNIASLCIVNIKEEKNLEYFSEILSKEFINCFPTDYWIEDKVFNIDYEFDDLRFHVSFNSEAKFKTKIEFNSNFSNLYNKILNSTVQIKKEINLEMNNIQEILGFLNEDKKILKLIKQYISQSGYKEFFGSSVYIPSSRSFFSTLDKNIWTLTDKNVIDIDPFMSRFGRAFEESKRMYSFLEENDKSYFESKLLKNNKKYNFSKSILKGEYKEINNRSWIIGENYKVNLSRASSGQQEVLPLLMVLTTSSIFINENKDTYFIEEPEAHLFPDAQNTIVSLLLSLFHERNTNFFITTHSPYILSAINNAILANEVIKKDNLTVEKYISLSDGAYPIDFDEISAFAVNNGNITDIKDYEYKMIGSEVIDSVSDLFQDIMNQLLLLDD